MKMNGPEVNQSSAILTQVQLVFIGPENLETSLDSLKDCNLIMKQLNGSAVTYIK
jgi:hypothetical protein